jgi:hypothetical protein
MAQQDGYIGHRDPLQQQFNGEGIAPSVGVSVLEPGIARRFVIGNPLTFLDSFLPPSDHLLLEILVLLMQRAVRNLAREIPAKRLQNA